MPMQPRPSSLTTRPCVPSFLCFTVPPDSLRFRSPRYGFECARSQGLFERGSVRLDPLVDAARWTAEDALDVIIRLLEVAAADAARVHLDERIDRPRRQAGRGQRAAEGVVVDPDVLDRPPEDAGEALGE